MNKKIIFVADFFSNEITGGGELNNDEFIALVKKKGYEITPVKSSLLTNHIAPEEHLINTLFYEKAVAIFCQSKLHKETVQKNLKLDTIHNLSGNLWSIESLSLLRKNSSKQKKKAIGIWNSANPIKNTSKAVAYCKIKNLPYELLGPSSYNEFLDALGKNDRFLFFPETIS